jgi:hypothetical protein
MNISTDVIKYILKFSELEQNTVKYLTKQVNKMKNKNAGSIWLLKNGLCLLTVKHG